MDVPAGHWVQIRGGLVYRYPDCYNVTGEWERAEDATLGEHLVRSPVEVRDLRLRPAQCCLTLR